MTELNFPYEPWDSKKDQRTLGVGTSRALALADQDLDFYSDQDSQEKQAHYIPVIREVIALLTECLDLLRWEGIDAATIENQVQAIRQANIAQPSRQAELALIKSGVLFSPDPTGLGEKLSESKKPRETR